MTKRSMVILSCIGIISLFILGLNKEILSALDFSVLLFLPIDILNKLANYLSQFDIVVINVLVWCLFIFVSYFPMLHLFLKKKRIIKESGLWIGILCSLNLFILYFFVNGVLVIDSVSPNISYSILLKVVGFCIYSSLLMIYYGSFKQEYGTVKAISKFLSFGISISIVVIVVSMTVPFVNLIAYEQWPGLNILLLTVLIFIFKIYTTRVLIKFYDLISEDLNSWRLESYKTNLVDFKEFSKKYIKVSIAFMFVTSLLLLFSISNIQEFNFDLSGLLINFVLIMLVMYFVEVISYGSEVQEENDGFI